VDDPASTSYTINTTGTQNHQGVHGFVTHHNGIDTTVNMPGENYYIGAIINNAGQVSGTYNANYGGFGCTSFFWENGALTLYPPPGVSSDDPHVYDMNDSGIVVGDFAFYSYRQGFILDHGSFSPFSLSPYVSSFDLDGQNYRLAGGFATIHGINNAGQLYGNLLLPNNKSFWYVASPIGMIPEPSTMTLLGLGAFALIRLRKKF
jgi:PEP-CTERM motif